MRTEENAFFMKRVHIFNERVLRSSHGPSPMADVSSSPTSSNLDSRKPMQQF